jgi:hypothetical protein
MGAAIAILVQKVVEENVIERSIEPVGLFVFTVPSNRRMHSTIGIDAVPKNRIRC